MKANWILTVGLLLTGCLQAQNWTGYPAGSLGVPYVNGLMTATVTRVNTTMNDGTPKFSTSTSPDCYIAAGCLAINTGFFNSYLANASRVQVDLDFTSGGNNGTCNSAAFTIRDINSGESFTDFLDVVEISAIDGNNAAIPPGNIVVTPPVNVTVVTVGNSKKIVGHNSASEVVTGGPYFSTPCNLTSVSVSPPANTPLRSIRIIYRPAVGTNSSNAYYSVGIRPAVQYISISNLTMTPTGGGCSVLPQNLLSFEGKPEATANLLTWTTTELGQRQTFLLEKSADGRHFLPMGSAAHLSEGNYEISDNSPFTNTWYRLIQRSEDGNAVPLATLLVDRSADIAQLFEMSPNPAPSQVLIRPLTEENQRITLLDAAGRQVWTQNTEGLTPVLLDCTALPAGLYMVHASFSGKSRTKKLVVSH